MASRTTFLQLVVPLNGEFEDTWDSPVNENWGRLDTFASGVSDEITQARFNKGNLRAFLEVAHNPDGTLKPTAEVNEARSSVTYGDEDEDETDLSLAGRLDLGDREILLARSGQPSLREGLAFRSHLKHQVIDGAKDSNGYPTWLGFTGTIVRIDGSVTPLWLMADGHVMRSRVQEEVNLVGESAGVKYIFAQYQPDGVVRVDGDSSTPPPAAPNGITGNDGTKDRQFTDNTVNFTTEDIAVGDILEILGTNLNSKEYRIREIGPGGNVNALLINGFFPGGTIASLDYVIKDMLSPTYGFDTTMTPAPGKIYIGEADFDGTSVTAVRALNFKDVFVSEWRAIDVGGGSPTFEEIFNHNLMSTELEFVVQVSQANDGTQPVELMSLATLQSTLGVTINNTLSFNAGFFDPGTTDATYSPLPSLTGGVSGSISGAVVNDSSVMAKFSRTQLFIKNAISARFYRDYDNVQRQTGFLRVIVRKRG